MKILIIHCVYQFKGGEETVVEEEFRLLQQAGIDVELLQFYNMGNSLTKYLQLPFNFSSYKKVRQKIKSFSPDVVHVHNLHFAASPSVIYAVKHSGVPLVCTLHNFRILCPSGTLFFDRKPFSDSLRSSFPFEAVKKGVYRNSRLLTFWMAVSMQFHHWLGTWEIPDRYIVLSRHAKDIFQHSKLKSITEKFFIKPNFCSVPALEENSRSDNFVYVGRLSTEKGIPLLLSTFASSPYKLIIAGDGPLKEDVIACSKKNSNISYAGSLSKEGVLALLKRASALVFPSIWYEGMPLTIIEAFACGTPVIATKLGAMEYMVTPDSDGLLFEVGSKEDLHQSLVEWTAFSPEEKERYSLNAFATYKKFYTPQKNVEHLLAVYNSVQKKSKPSSLAFAGWPQE